MDTRITLFALVAAIIVTVKKLLLESNHTFMADFRVFKRMMDKRKGKQVPKTPDDPEAENFPMLAKTSEGEEIPTPDSTPEEENNVLSEGKSGKMPVDENPDISIEREDIQ